MVRDSNRTISVTAKLFNRTNVAKELYGTWFRLPVVTRALKIPKTASCNSMTYTAIHKIINCDKSIGRSRYCVTRTQPNASGDSVTYTALHDCNCMTYLNVPTKN